MLVSGRMLHFPCPNLRSRGLEKACGGELRERKVSIVCHRKGPFWNPINLVVPCIALHHVLPGSSRGESLRE